MDGWNKASKKTKEAVIAKDADYLEGMIQAKDYLEHGYKHCKEWLVNYRKALKTPPAKRIAKAIEKSKPWWEGLKELD